MPFKLTSKHISPVLWKMVRSDDRFTNIHGKLGVDNLRLFLTANMDEIRLRNAEAFAAKLLNVNQYDEVLYIRRGVLRRELWMDVEYQRHRDHTAHTLNNYLTGWYFFLHSKIIYNTLLNHFSKRDESFNES